MDNHHGALDEKCITQAISQMGAWPALRTFYPSHAEICSHLPCSIHSWSVSHFRACCPDHCWPGEAVFTAATHQLCDLGQVTEDNESHFLILAELWHWTTAWFYCHFQLPAYLHCLLMKMILFPFLSFSHTASAAKETFLVRWARSRNQPSLALDL